MKLAIIARAFVVALTLLIIVLIGMLVLRRDQGAHSLHNAVSLAKQWSWDLVATSSSRLTSAARRAFHRFSLPDFEFAMPEMAPYEELAAPPSPTDDSMLDLVLLPAWYVGAYSARCMDGSTPGFYWSKSSASHSDGDRHNWVISLEGGGACNTEPDCRLRTFTHLGSSDYFASTVPGADLMTSNCSINPTFCNYNRVYVKYCSGDVWSGTMTERNDWGFHFAGHNILAATLQLLYDSYKLGKADRVLFAGSSAGGLGVFINADDVTALLHAWNPQTRVLATAQAGWYFPDVLSYDAWQSDGEGPSDLPQMLSAMFLLYQPHVDQTCASSFGDTAWQCLSLNSLWRFISTPVFVVENVYDQEQIGTELGCSRDSPNFAEFQSYFGEHMRASLAQVSASIDAGSRDALFMQSCYSHVANIGTMDFPVIGGSTYRDTLSAWFLDDQQMGYFNFADSCTTPGCNPTCDGLSGVLDPSLNANGDNDVDLSLVPTVAPAHWRKAAHEVQLSRRGSILPALGDARPPAPHGSILAMAVGVLFIQLGVVGSLVWPCCCCGGRKTEEQNSTSEQETGETSLVV